MIILPAVSDEDAKAKYPGRLGVSRFPTFASRSAARTLGRRPTCGQRLA